MVRIGCHEFECIGDKPPQDHPHIYLKMGDANDCRSSCSAFCRPNLFQVAEQSGASLGHAGIGRLAARRIGGMDYCLPCKAKTGPLFMICHAGEGILSFLPN